MRNLKRALIGLLLAALVPACLAEDGIVPSELDVGPHNVQNVWQGDPYAAVLLVGYVGGEGAQVNPFYCSDQGLISLNQLVFESLVTLDDSQKPVP